jgi:hypothetical protein
MVAAVLKTRANAEPAIASRRARLRAWAFISRSTPLKHKFLCTLI